MRADDIHPTGWPGAFARRRRQPRWVRRAAAALLPLAVGCHPTRSRAARGPAPPPSAARWLVLAPHPDDEVLIAGGVLARAASEGAPLRVVVMTNGDDACVHDGLTRERESLDGLAQLGVDAGRVSFLGYPDGALARLGRAPLPRRRRVGGRCVEGYSTYGALGRGGADYHFVRFGAHAKYTRGAVVSDLAAVLAEFRPTDVVTTHPLDTHADHAATYALLRAAIERLAFAPRIHRAMVHNGDCWPIGAEAREPCPARPALPADATPPLPGRLLGYAPGERRPVPTSCASSDPSRNAKVRAIGAHRSQTRGLATSYLFGFARRDEVFFPETLERRGRGWLRRGSAADDAMVFSTLALRSGEAQAFEHAAPLVAEAELPRGETTLSLEDDQGGYALRVDGLRREARVERLDASGGRRELHRWPLPHDLFSADEAESFLLRIDPRPEDGDLVELSLYCHGSLVGVAIDLHPHLRGTRVRVDGASVALRVRQLPAHPRAPRARSVDGPGASR